MDSRQLRYFVAVAEHGGVTKAAKALQVAQPTLTQGLRALERDLGVELFHRVGRGMVLSAAGEALLGPAMQVGGGLAALVDKARSIARLDGGWLNLVTSPGLGVDPLTGIIGMFRARYPKVCVNVLDPGTTSINELLRTAACEIAMTFLPAAVTGMVSVPLGVRRLLLVLPPESPIGSRMPVRLAELAGLPLVAGPRGNPIRDLLEVSCAPGAPLNISVETESEEHARDLVLVGAGAALLPQSLAEQAGLRGALVRRTDPVLEQRIGVVHRSGPLSPAAVAFVDLSSEFAAAQDL
ncbi:LysR family transcriptional regulator [Saccharopolyspora sp. NPDC050642]|uniref:LysR family transcriptional regulator n=1 Tax=Saccharopolyspora sp. NPDC050642 TaxID=3157099 RepID=UPI0033F7232D